MHNSELPTPNLIESATEFEKAIEIIPEEECRQGVAKLQETFYGVYPDPETVSIVPILRGGARIGQALADVHESDVNPMQMSYYDEQNARLEEPRCLVPPDIGKIIRAKSVAFAEAVVDSQGTILKAIEIIKGMIDQYNEGAQKSASYPEFYTFALVSKTNGSHAIPHLIAMFAVHPDIWVHGWGCDNGQLGREDSRIMGIQSPFATVPPVQPYYHRIIS